MTKKSEKEFCLDEHAAETHYPLGWQIKTIELEPSGKAPKKYGPDTYRFSAALTLSVILPRRGWELAKQTKNYAYLRPPESQDGPPFQIDIAMPSPKDFLEIADRSYARGQSWMGQLGEWPAWYFHEQKKDMREMWRNPNTGEMESKLHEYPPQSSLSVGEWGVWEMKATAENGQFALGILPPSMVPEFTADLRSSLQGASLWEGSPKPIELTSYERNPAARSKCIEHFGPTCQACGLNYEQCYGAIGVGLIHVHHIVPLAVKGQEHEVDPLRDLVPLCATCHHVVHSRMPALSVEEVKLAVEAAKSSGT